MAWKSTEWACGHSGSMQLYGPGANRRSRVAYEAGRKCMACWLIEQWEAKGDPRGKKDNRGQLACDIAEGKGIRIDGTFAPPVAVMEKEINGIGIGA